MLKKLDSKDGMIIALLSTILFSIQFPLIRLSFKYLSGDQGVLVEIFLTAVISYFYLKYKNRSNILLMRKELIFAAFLNIAGLLLLFKALDQLHPALVGFIGRLYFIYAITIARFYFKEAYTKTEWLLSILTIVGVFLASVKENNNLFNNINAGFIMAALYPAFFAIQNAVVKKSIGPEESALKILFSTKLFAFMMLIIFYCIWKPTVFFLSWNLNGVGILFISTFLSTFLGLSLLYLAMKTTSFNRLNLMKATEPIFVLGFSACLFQIEINNYNITGLLLIALSTIGLTFFENKN